MDWTPVLAALSTLLVGVIGALGAYIVAKLKKETTKEEVEELKIKQQSLEKDLKKVEIQAALKHYYTKCQKCGNVIDLSTADIITEDELNEMKEKEKSEETNNDNN